MNKNECSHVMLERMFGGEYVLLTKEEKEIIEELRGKKKYIVGASR